VHPIDTLLVVLPDELVEVEVATDVVEYSLALCHVAAYVDVGSLARHVLRVGHTLHRPVKGRTTIAARYADRFFQSRAQGLQHVHGEVGEVHYRLLGRCIVYALRLRRGAGIELFEGEISCEVCHVVLVVLVVV